MSARSRRLRLLLWSFLAITTSVAAGAGVYRVTRIRNDAKLPTAPARKGDFLVIVRCRGELKARLSVQITAPVVPNLKIVWLAQPGSAVKAGDPVIRFDASSALEQLREKEAALKQAQAAWEQAGAEARTTAQQDQRDLISAAYDVVRARLEASKSEILSTLQGE